MLASATDLDCGQSVLFDPFETLHAFSRVDLAGKNIALRIDRYCVDPVELAGIAALTAEGGNCITVVAQQDVDLVVGAVGDEQVLCSGSVEKPMSQTAPMKRVFEASP